MIAVQTVVRNLLFETDLVLSLGWDPCLLAKPPMVVDHRYYANRIAKAGGILLYPALAVLNLGRLGCLNVLLEKLVVLAPPFNVTAGLNRTLGDVDYELFKTSCKIRRGRLQRW